MVWAFILFFISVYNVLFNCTSLFFIDCGEKFLYIAFMAKKPLSTQIDNDLQKEIKKLAIDLERPFNDLLEEAIQDILKKYEKKAKK